MIEEQKKEPSQAFRISWKILFMIAATALFYYAYIYASTGSTYCYFSTIITQHHTRAASALIDALLSGLCSLFDTYLENRAKTTVGAISIILLAIGSLKLAMWKFPSPDMGTLDNQDSPPAPSSAKGLRLSFTFKVNRKRKDSAAPIVKKENPFFKK